MTARGAGLSRLRWRWNPRHEAVRTVVRLGGWTFGFVLANQIALFVVLALAVGASGPDPVSSYTYAYTFMQMPYAVVAVSVMSAVTPGPGRAVDHRRPDRLPAATVRRPAGRAGGHPAGRHGDVPPGQAGGGPAVRPRDLHRRRRRRHRIGPGPVLAGPAGLLHVPLRGAGPPVHAAHPGGLLALPGGERDQHRAGPGPGAPAGRPRPGPLPLGGLHGGRRLRPGRPAALAGPAGRPGHLGPPAAGCPRHRGYGCGGAGGLQPVGRPAGLRPAAAGGRVGGRAGGVVFLAASTVLGRRAEARGGRRPRASDPTYRGERRRVGGTGPAPGTATSGTPGPPAEGGLGFGGGLDYGGGLGPGTGMVPSVPPRGAVRLVGSSSGLGPVRPVGPHDGVRPATRPRRLGQGRHGGRGAAAGHLAGPDPTTPRWTATPPASPPSLGGRTRLLPGTPAVPDPSPRRAGLPRRAREAPCPASVWSPTAPAT